MSIIKFLKSKEFFKQILLAVVALFVFCFIMLKWLNMTTNHGDFETVPDLKGKSIDVAKIELEENNLVMQIQDSANYNPNYPKFSVIEHDPPSGEKVKENRKIYVTLNPSGYRKVLVPDLRGRTFRQAKPALQALGFKIGNISFVNDIGENEVIEINYKGKQVAPETMLGKTSKLDIVLGNGKSN